MRTLIFSRPCHCVPADGYNPNKIFFSMFYNRLTNLLFLLLLIIMVHSGTRAQDFLKVSGKQIINEKGQNVLLRGVGLGGWMLQEGYMLQLSGLGMQHRIRAKMA